VIVSAGVAWTSRPSGPGHDEHAAAERLSGPSSQAFANPGWTKSAADSGKPPPGLSNAEREQPGAVIRAVERDDAWTAGREQRGAQRDLNGVLAGHAELGRLRQRLAQALRHLCFGEVAERVHDRLLGPRANDARVAVAKRSDAEAGGEVDELAALRVPNARPLRARPDHGEPLRREKIRLTVSLAT
jgi:hypothetical protein